MKFYLTLFVFILSCSILAQKAVVSLACDSKSVETGESISFNVKTNVEGTVDFNFPKSFTESPGTSSGMEQVMDYNTGTFSTVYYISKSGVFEESGNFVIQAYIKGRKAVYKSNKITVNVVKASENDDQFSSRNLKQALFGLIIPNKKKLYEGEALVLEAKAFAKINITMLENYQAYEMESGGDKHELDKSAKLSLEKEQIKGSTYLSFTYDKNVYFPTKIGKNKISPFEMVLQYDDGGFFSDRVGLKSNPLTIEVMALPNGAPKDFIGAVGVFDVNYELVINTNKKGAISKLIVTVSGVGNLHATSKPKINYGQDFQLYGDPEIKEDYFFGTLGAEGKIVYTYNLKALHDNPQFNGLSISYFHPESKKYKTVKRGLTNLKNVITNQTSIATNENQIIENEEIKEKNEVSSRTQSSTNWSYFWLGSSILIPVLLILFFVLFKKSPQATENKIVHDKRKKQAFNSKKWLSFYQSNFHHLSYQEKINTIDQHLKSLPNYFEPNLSTNHKNEILQEVEKFNPNLNNLIRHGFIKIEELRYAFEEKNDEIDELIEKFKKFKD